MSLGDKGSIFHHDLWALEGKPSADGFLPVEVPELSTLKIVRRISELHIMIIFICHPLRSLADPTAQRASRRPLPLWTASPQL